eukprot:1953363-Rhodomonas_salina.1
MCACAHAYTRVHVCVHAHVPARERGEDLVVAEDDEAEGGGGGGRGRVGGGRRGEVHAGNLLGDAHELPQPRRSLSLSAHAPVLGCVVRGATSE